MEWNKKCIFVEMYFFIPYVVLSALIAEKIGAKRKIGLGWSFFFCFFFSPLIGLLITLISPKNYDNKNIKPSLLNWVFTFVFFVISILFFSFAVLSSINGVDSYELYLDVNPFLYGLILGIGFLGAALYTSNIEWRETVDK